MMTFFNEHRTLFGFWLYAIPMIYMFFEGMWMVISAARSDIKQLNAIKAWHANPANAATTVNYGPRGPRYEAKFTLRLLLKVLSLIFVPIINLIAALGLSLGHVLAGLDKIFFSLDKPILKAPKYD